MQIPLILVLQTSSVSLGSLALYRSSLQSIAFCFRSILATIRMAFQTIFLMSAFCASTSLKPKLQPSDKDMVTYTQEKEGLSIKVK
jgi:hypothetical protein